MAAQLVGVCLVSIMGVMECKVFMHRNCQKMRYSNAIAHDTLISKDQNFSHEQNRSSEQEMQALTSKGFGCDVGCCGRHNKHPVVKKTFSMAEEVWSFLHHI